MEDGKITHEGSLIDIKEQDPEIVDRWQEAIEHTRYAMFSEPMFFVN